MERRAIDWPAWHCSKHQIALNEEFECPHGHSVPVVAGIPRFVSSDNYAVHFGKQWKRYRLTQLDSYTGKPITRTRLQRCLGNLWPTIGNRQVLECGCGAGRFTEILLDAGALVTSVDLSDAVEANAQTFSINDTHRIAQADIMALPFAPEQFDIVICLGVIQHTPSPEATIAALYQQVRPGGWLIIDHYKREFFRWYSKTAPVVRAILKRMPRERSLRITEALVNSLLPIHRKVANKRLLRSAWCRISPVLTHYNTYPELDDELQRQWSLLDTHDSLTDWFKHRRNVNEIQRVLSDLGAQSIECWYGGNGVEARAQRPEKVETVLIAQ
ncbi:MAG: methyltransferase domain-containing protein [Acidobacteriaceae bacterium]|nr:methyltransferase domain-containing protein [Acidobacteriaceae bacterium]